MLHALLMILKILLWIVLAILGLIVVFALLVLLSPIRYKLDIKYHGSTLIKAKICFLIATVRIMFDQQSKKLDYNVSLAGIKFKLSKKNKQKQVNHDKSNCGNLESTEIQPIENVENKLTTQSAQDVETDGLKSEKLDSEKLDSWELDHDEFNLFDGNAQKDVPEEELGVLGRIKSLIIKIVETLNNTWIKLSNFSLEQISEKINNKIKKLKRKINKFKKFWNLKCTVKTRKYLKKYLLGLVKHIGPRKIKGYVRYGFKDPCKTGQVTGYLSLLPFVYDKQFSLEPDFYEKIIDTEMLIKGRIRLGYILRIVLKINIWRTILVANKIFRSGNSVSK